MFIGSNVLKSVVRLPIIVEGIGTQLNQCHIKRDSGYPIHQLIFSKKGTGKVSAGNCKQVIHKNEFVYLKPDEAHYYHGNNSQWSTDWILFECLSDDLLKLLGYHESFVSSFHVENYEEIFYRIASILKSDEINSSQKASAEMYRLLIELTTPVQKNTLNSHEKLEHLIEYINNNFGKQLMLEELAERVKITPQYLCKIFKDHYQMTLFDYIKQKRLHKAKELLIETGLSIKEIALQVGYQESSYFGVHFKKSEGVSASEFRGKK